MTFLTLNRIIGFVKALRFTPLQIFVHLGSWVPLAVLILDAINQNLSINPIQTAEQRTGFTALIWLLLSLACTPLNTLFGFRQALKLRRPLGLYAFLYALLHFGIFIFLDYQVDIALLALDIAQKWYIFLGAGALLILSLLALTSFDKSKVKLGKNWKRLHRLVYLAGVLVVFHFSLASKGNLFGLSGDIARPLVAGLILVGLLILRIPVIRRWIAGQKPQKR